jgi:hypothetical protein
MRGGSRRLAALVTRPGERRREAVATTPGGVHVITRDDLLELLRLEAELAKLSDHVAKVHEDFSIRLADVLRGITGGVSDELMDETATA